MTDTTPAKSIATQEKTTAGNYFISNYPPYSFWSADRADEAYGALDRSPDTKTPLGLYVHIPFCRKRCHFCYFRVYTGKNSSEVNQTLDALAAELSLYAEREFVGGRKLNFVYFGGGTPSYLSTDQLRSLSSRLKALLPWDDAEEVAFECEPGTLTEKKLEVIKEVGVTRLSLGLENFDDKILEVNGRAHRSKEIGRAYAFARSLAFEQINIDLIAGMVGETEDNWKRCVEKTIEMLPESVTIYQMEIPYNTTIYQEMQAKHEDLAPVADWPTKRRWVDYAFAQLEQNGYTVASAYTAVRDPEKTQFVYRDRLWQGADMVGLGVASISHVGGTHFQNEHNLDPYLARVEKGELPIYRALTPSEDERLIREFILQLKLGKLQRGYFQEKYHVDILERFAEPLAHWQREGLMDYDQEGVRLNRAGLLRADGLLPAFFLPQHRDVRFV